MTGARTTSIIIVTYNHRATISRCLDGVRPELGPGDQVLVVDNASRDGSAEVVAEQYPWVTLIRSSSNVGFGAACNLGARRGSGEYLVFLNPDTEPLTGWLGSLLSGIDATTTAALATATLILARAPHLIDTVGNDVHISGITTSRGWGEPAAGYSANEELSAVSGACFAVRREIFWELNGFDEQLFLYYEDTDLSLRARLAGLRCVAMSTAIVAHDHRPGFSASKLRHLERNRWRTLLKVYQWRTLVALTPALLMAECLAWVMAIRSGPRHVSAKLWSYVEVARCWSELQDARQRVQRTRVVADADLIRLHSTRLRFGQVVSGGLSTALEEMTAALFAACRAFALVVVGL